MSNHVEARIFIGDKGKVAIFIDSGDPEVAKRVSAEMLADLSEFVDIEIVAEAPERHDGPNHKHHHHVIEGMVGQ